MVARLARQVPGHVTAAVSRKVGNEERLKTPVTDRHIRSQSIGYDQIGQNERYMIWKRISDVIRQGEGDTETHMEIKRWLTELVTEGS